MFRPDRFAVASSTMDHLVGRVVCLPLPCQAAQWARMAALIPVFRPRLPFILEQNELQVSRTLFYFRQSDPQ